MDKVVNKSKISIIIPMKNESNSLDKLFNRLYSVLNKIKDEFRFEIIAVNDGSTDNTLEMLLQFVAINPEIKVVDLSRNFGKEAALFAGFSYATGDCAVAIDADLQDPPELVLEMLEHWQQGYEVVTAVHNFRETDTYLKRKTAQFFYWAINKISDVKMTPHAGDYRLLDRKVIDAFLSLQERVRFNKGLFTWLGFKEKLIYHVRDSRAVGLSQWSYFKLFKFAIDGMTSFSSAPLEIWFYLGIITSFFGFLYGIFIFIHTIVLGIDVPGYASLLIFILFFSGLQMIGIGIIGKYLGRLFIEAKHRPIFIARKFYENNTKEK